MAENIFCSIKTDSGPFPVRDLSEFLYVFRAVYICAVDELSKQDAPEIYNPAQLELIVAAIEEKMSEWTPQTFSLYATRKISPEEDIQINDIRRTNPTDFNFIALAPALLAAAVIAGGTYQFETRNVKLPNLRSAINMIRAKSLWFVNKIRGPKA